MKAGGCGFESHLSSLFSMKIEKRALSLFLCLVFKKSKFTCVCISACMHVGACRLYPGCFIHSLLLSPSREPDPDHLPPPGSEDMFS